MQEQANMEGQKIARTSGKNRRWIILGVIILLVIFLAVGIFVKGEPRKTGTAMLQWTANSETNLAGYKIYYGSSAKIGTDPKVCAMCGYEVVVDIGKTSTPENPIYLIKDLQEGKTYYFSITSYTDKNIESSFSSDEVSKTIQKSSPAQKLWQKIKDLF